MTTPAHKHGDERNRRVESSWNPVAGQAADGSTVELGSGMTQTVAEKYCATCNAWILTKGVLGGLRFEFEHAPGHGAPEAR